MKKFCVFVLILCTAAFVFAGGGQSGAGSAAVPAGAYVRDPNLNAKGTFPLNKNKVTLRIGVEQLATVEDWETNWQTLQVEKNGNYDLVFEIYPAGELNQKVELMVMAGGNDLPDVVLGAPGLGVLTKYGQAGMVIPTNQYFENSTYWYDQNKGGFPIDILKYITSYDGNIYGMFRILGAINNEYSASWMMIYEPWLQKLGLKMPETTVEFVNVMRAFRDSDPNGNGINTPVIPRLCRGDYRSLTITGV